MKPFLQLNMIVEALVWIIVAIVDHDHQVLVRLSSFQIPCEEFPQATSNVDMLTFHIIEESVIIE